jgi:hypothetical protein
MAIAALMPALAQTRVVTLKAADEVVAAILSPRGDRIAAAVGKDRVAVWSLPDDKLLQELRFPQRTISALLGFTTIPHFNDYNGTHLRNMKAVVRQARKAIEAGSSDDAPTASVSPSLASEAARGSDATPLPLCVRNRR